jgi:hypothetical protein
MNFANHLAVKQVAKHASTCNLLKNIDPKPSSANSSASKKSMIIKNISSRNLPVLKAANFRHIPLLASGCAFKNIHFTKGTPSSIGESPMS